jgi:Rrf2 family iron-sulfur cluster assembly transcriptional regulator
MLRISRRADYAVRTMIALAQAPQETFIATSNVGDEMDIPHPFLVKVIGDLKQADLIETAVGRNGGICLAQDAEDISLYDIIEAVDGPIILNACLTRPGECSRDTYCPVHPVWHRVQRMLHDELDAVDLVSLAKHGYAMVRSAASGTT